MAKPKTARGKAQKATSAATDKAQQAKEVTSETTSEVAGQAKGGLREQVDQRSTQAGEQVSSAAGDLRSVGEELRRQGKDRPARVADQAAERAERLGGYLKESDGERILSDIEDFGRGQPWAVAGAGLALGFVTSRFVKASSGRRYEALVAERREAGGRATSGPSATDPASSAVPVERSREPVGSETYSNPGL